MADVTPGLARSVETFRKKRGMREVSPDGPLLQELNTGLAFTLGLPADVAIAVLGDAAVNAIQVERTGSLPKLGGRRISRPIQFGRASRALQTGLHMMGVAPAPGEERTDIAGRTMQAIGGALVPVPLQLARGAQITSRLQGATARSDVAARPSAPTVTGFTTFRGPGAGIERFRPKTLKKSAREVLDRELGKGRVVTSPLQSPTAVERSLVKGASSRSAAVGTAFLEGFAGATAGASGALAEELFPNSPASRAVAELFGGFAGALAPAVLPVRLGVEVAGGIKNKIFQGSERRAAKRLAKVSGDPEAARERIIAKRRRMEKLVNDGMDPDQARRVVEAEDFGETTAVRSGDVGIMRLEQLYANTDPQIAKALVDQNKRAAQSARDLLRVGTIDNVQSYFRENTRLAAVKALRAVRSIRKRLPSVRSASIAARQEINTTLRAVRRHENLLYNRVSGVIPVGLRNTHNRYRGLLVDLADTADKEALIPGYLREFLGDLDKGTFTTGSLGVQSSFKNVRQLRSRVLDDIREELGKPGYNRNKVRILTRIENAILDDLDATQGGAQLRVATRFSRELNKRFTQGDVGNLLGYDNRGSLKFEPEETFEGLVGVKTGEDQYVASRALLRAGVDPHRLEDYSLIAFTNQATDDTTGRVVPELAAQWKFKNRGMLDALEERGTGGPTLRDRLAKVSDMQQLVDERLGKPVVSELSPALKVKSVMAMFMETPLDKGVERIFTQTENPRAATIALMREATRDPSGQAMDGLKAGYWDWLFRMGEVGSQDGVPIVSGEKMQRVYLDKKTNSAFRALYTPEELDRLDVVIDFFKRAELRRSQTGATGDLLDDELSWLSKIALGFTGAQVGGKAGEQTAGVSLVLARGGAEMARKIGAKIAHMGARDLLGQALRDDTTMRAVLVGAGARPSEKLFALRIIANFLGTPAGTLARQESEPEQSRAEVSSRLKGAVEAFKNR